jgi:hypothetical protein
MLQEPAGTWKAGAVPQREPRTGPRRVGAGGEWEEEEKRSATACKSEIDGRLRLPRPSSRVLLWGLRLPPSLTINRHVTQSMRFELAQV